MHLPLTLLVTWIGADDQHLSMAADDLALLAHRLDRRSYLHEPLLADVRNRARDEPAAGATSEGSKAAMADLATRVVVGSAI
jgi:hypothetical protein